MVSSQVKRTLVKSPPELWAELSDPASLARHLEAFEELRITRVDPESTIEWEARGASGTVAIKPSGWGTQVVLSATRDLPPDQAAPEVAPPAEGPAVAEADVAREATLTQEPAEQVLTEPAHDEPAEQVLTEPAQEEPAEQMLTEPAEQALEEQGDEEEPAPEPVAEGPGGGEEERQVEEDEAPAPRRRLFKRLFGRMRSRREGAAESASTMGPEAIDDQHATDETPVTDEPSGSDPRTVEPRTVAEPPTVAEQPTLAEEVSVAELSPLDEPATMDERAAAEDPATGDGDEPQASGRAEVAEAGGSEAARDVVQELAALEQRLAEETTALLASVLDRLGAAHHRPFSRS